MLLKRPKNFGKPTSNPRLFEAACGAEAGILVRARFELASGEAQGGSLGRGPKRARRVEGLPNLGLGEGGGGTRKGSGRSRNLRHLGCSGHRVVGFVV